MSRHYKVTFENVLVSAVQDLVQIIGATGKIVKVKEVNVSCVDTSLATGQMLQLRCRFLPATVTNGSGGSSPTPAAMAGDSAASLTAKANSTTQATTSGTAVVHRTDGCHLFTGYTYSFPVPVEVGPSESFTFELNNAVSGTVHLSGGALVEELGG